MFLRLLLTLILSLSLNSTYGEESDRVEFKVTENFKSPPPSEMIDGLIVIDNSMSMYFIMNNIESKWINFLSPLEGTNFRFGIVDSNTSEDGSKYLIPLKYDSQNSDERVFIHRDLDDPRMVLVNSLNTLRCKYFPFCGNGKERPLGALVQYFKSQQNELIRQETDKLFVLILTDNEESNKRGEKVPTTAQEVINVFEYTFPNKDLIVLTFTVTEGFCEEKIKSNFLLSIFGEALLSQESIELSKQTGGEVFNLCLDSYEAASKYIMETVRFNYY